MMNTVVCALTNLFRIYILLKYVKLFFEEKEIDVRKKSIVCGLFFVINTGLYLQFHLPWINVTTNFLGIAFLVLLYSKRIGKIIFITSIICAINMACDTIAVLALVNYQLGQEFNQFCTVITVLLFLCCQILLEKVLYVKNKDANVQNLPLLIVPLCSILILIFVGLFDARKEITLIGLSIGLLIINFLILYLYNMLLRVFARKYENEILEQRMQEYENQLSIIAESDERVASLRHDLKHHLCELSVMAEQNKASDMKEYLHDMIDFLQNPKEIMATGNREVDSLLNFWLGKAKRSLRQVKAEVKIPEELSDTFDVNTVLGNLLENAIEAASQTEEQSLEISVRYDRGFLQINMKNSCPDNLQKQDNGYATTKKDKKHHGLGLKNVKRIVDKYHGELELREQESTFFTNVVLFL